MATYYLDPNGGNDSNNGTTFALRKKTLASFTGATSGDIIRVIASNSYTMTPTASWGFASKTATLSASMTQNLWTNQGIWTTASSCTVALNTSDYKANTTTGSCSLTSTSTSTVTRRMAYFATGTLNLSSYQQLSLWVKSSLTVSANNFTIRLCSDTVGNTTVNTFALPALTAGQWTCVTVDNAAALGSSIQSIALYTVTGYTGGLTTLLLDNIFVTGASSGTANISLNTLIRPSADSTAWYGIQSIVGTTVLLDGPVNTLGNSTKGYGGTGVTNGALLAMVPFNLPSGNSFAGTTGAIQFQGGWDTTAMSSQTGYSAFDGTNGSGSGYTSAFSGTIPQLVFKNCIFTRYAQALMSTTSGVNINVVTQNSYFCNNSGFLYNFDLVSGTVLSFTGCSFSQNATTAMSVSTASTNTVSYSSSCYALSNLSAGFTSVYGNNAFDTCTSRYNTGDGFSLQNEVMAVTNCTAASNLSGYGFRINPTGQLGKFQNNTATSNSFGNLFTNGVVNSNMYNITLDATVIPMILGDSQFNIYGLTLPSGSITIRGTSLVNVYNWTASGLPNFTFTNPGNDVVSSYPSINIQGQAGWTGSPANTVYQAYGSMTTKTTPTQSGSGISYAVTPLSTALTSAQAVVIPVGQIACPGGKTTTLTVYYSNANTSGTVSGQLRVTGGQFAGVGSIGTNLTTAITTTASTSTFTTVSLAVAPTSDSVITFYFDTWLATGSVTNPLYFCGPVTINSV